MNKIHKKFGLNAFSLKIIACISMLIDHIAAVIFMVGFGYKNIHTLGNNAVMYYSYARSIGRIAFPIFAFLVVEGFIHTRDTKKYAFRMFIFALISQIPYNLAFGQRIFYTEKFIPAYTFGNVMWTFLLGIVMMYIMKKVENKDIKDIYKYLLFIIIIIVFATIAHYIKCDRKEYGILAVALFYIFRESRCKQLLTTIISLRTQPEAAKFALIPIALYNGERGPNIKYLFYVFYPAHFLILTWIRSLYI